MGHVQIPSAIRYLSGPEDWIGALRTPIRASDSGAIICP